MDKIKICSNHEEYQVPLIWTFSFPGAEYWCPHCGYINGMFGAGEEVDETSELKKRLELFKKFSEGYLDAKGTQVCDRTKWKGKYIKPVDLPDEEKHRLINIVADWKYNIKIEEREDAK